MLAVRLLASLAAVSQTDAVAGSALAAASIPHRGRLMRTEALEPGQDADGDEEGPYASLAEDGAGDSNSSEVMWGWLRNLGPLPDGLSFVDLVQGPLGPIVNTVNQTGPSVPNWANETVVNPPKKYGPFTMMGARDLMSFCKDNKEGIRCDSMKKGRKRDRFWLIQDLGVGWGGWSALQGGREDFYCRVNRYDNLNPAAGGRIMCDIAKLDDLNDLGKFRFDLVNFDMPDVMGVKRKWNCLRNLGADGFCTNGIDRIDCGPNIKGAIQQDYFANTLYEVHTTTTAAPTTTMTYSFNIVMPQNDLDDQGKEWDKQEAARKKAYEDQLRRQALAREQQVKEKQKEIPIKTETVDTVASGKADKVQGASDGAPPPGGGFR